MISNILISILKYEKVTLAATPESLNRFQYNLCLITPIITLRKQCLHSQQPNERASELFLII